MMFILLVGAIVLWLLYKYWVSVYDTWGSRNIPSIKGRFPFGSVNEASKIFSYQGEIIDELYKKSPSPYFGIYSIRTPFLVIKDPDIVKLVLAKEFSHFRNRTGIETSKDDILSNHLFNLEGERWRALRVKMSPTFTSGKLKAMFSLFVKCSEALDSLVQTFDSTEADVKDIVGRFTADTICSCAFGIESNTMKNSTAADVRRLGDDVFVYNMGLKLKMLILKTFPKYFRSHPLRVASKKTEDTILKFMKETIDYRVKTGIKRHDFIDLLLEMKEKGKLHDDDAENNDEEHLGNSVEMTLELMAAQVYVFLLAGYETSSSVQSYCLYELALHPEVQERLYNEIESTLEKHGGELSYQAILEMEYLDMVIHETMRKYPTLPQLTRCCTKPFSMPAGNRIEVGDMIIIPVWSLHHDPQYFPKPEEFDPERFSKENKELIKPYSYLPFGEGPRICIGMRFGLLQTKVGLITVLRKYKVEPSPRTQIPLKFTGSLIVTTVANPIYLNVKKRMPAK